MKRIAKLFLAFFLFAILINSCDIIENCGTCSLVTEEDGVEVSRTAGVPYCGDELEEKKNASPTIIGNTKTYWDCN